MGGFFYIMYDRGKTDLSHKETAEQDRGRVATL
jgi:hypothetical protein